MKHLTEKGIVLPDLHVPYHDTSSLRAIEAYVREEGKRRRWDFMIQLGDFLDLNEVSQFVKDRPGDVEENVHDTFSAGNGVLGDLVDLIRHDNSKAEVVMIEGNHEYRVEDYMSRHPELAGTLDIYRNLGMREKGVQWIRFAKSGHLYNKGNAYFGHGRYTNEHHAKKMVLNYGTNLYYGHTHDVQEFPLVQYGRDKVIVGKSLGCLCLPEQKYLKGAPTKWQQAFSVFYFFSDGFYTEHTVRIFKNRFVSPEGRIYDGNDGKVYSA